MAITPLGYVLASISHHFEPIEPISRVVGGIANGGYAAEIQDFGGFSCSTGFSDLRLFSPAPEHRNPLSY